MTKRINTLALNALADFEKRFNRNTFQEFKPTFYAWHAMRKQAGNKPMSFDFWKEMVDQLIESVRAALSTPDNEKARSFYQENSGIRIQVDVMNGRPDKLTGWHQPYETHATLLIVQEEFTG